MRIVLVPVGSAGDVHPYIGIALALKDRGHDVSVIANPHFEPLIRNVGLRLIPWATADQFDAITQHPDLWHAVKGLAVIAGGLRMGMPELYRLVQVEHRAGDLLLVAPGLAFAARVAHETLGIPLVTMHLQPSSIVSTYDSPVLHPSLRHINMLPRPAKSLLFKLLDRVADHMLAPAANELRATLNLPPVRHITSRWWHSPQRVVGLFPGWFAPPQPDWPSQVVLTGFPLYDETDASGIPTEVERFLDAGTPPIVYAPGSSNRQASRFFAAAVDASERLQRRAIFLTRYPEQIPARLPDSVRHFDYVPFSQLLQRAAALVHHGGIGTAAQALAARLPQLVMPMAFDQHDNARRLENLGVASALRPGAFRGPAVARALEQLLGSPAVTTRCARLARRLRSEDPVTQTCELIENLSQDQRPG